MVAKKKALTVEVPQNDDEANALIARYGDTFNAITRMGVDLDEELAEVKARHEEAVKPLQIVLKDTAEAIETYAAANRKRLTEGGETKTVKMGAGEIGWRKNPPSVKWLRGFKEEDVLLEVMKRRITKFLRRKVSINKQAMLEDQERAEQIPGVRIVKDVEEFYVAPFGAELAERH